MIRMYISISRLRSINPLVRNGQCTMHQVNLVEIETMQADIFVLFVFTSHVLLLEFPLYFIPLTNVIKTYCRSII